MHLDKLNSGIWKKIDCLWRVGGQIQVETPQTPHLVSSIFFIYKTCFVMHLDKLSRILEFGRKLIVYDELEAQSKLIQSTRLFF